MTNPHSEQHKVLVIDDDPAVVATLADGLQLLGDYEVIIASDGAEGLRRFYASLPECVVVDVRMPRLNGYQFVRAMRGDPETAEIPIIILSALVQDHEQLAGFLSGADVYLLKPVEITELMAAIDTAINRTAEQRAEQMRLLADEP
ncbi:MAG TPA: response regulator [Ktedonobacterales bacterium]|jgi:two-component system alkaline phosphatase synthesis response regulator PhoP